MNNHSKEIYRFKYEYFLKELETISHYRTSFSTSRLLVLGGSITLLSVIVQMASKAELPHMIMIHIMVFAIISTTVKMILSYSGTIYVFFDYIDNMERNILEVRGFSSAWDKYLFGENGYNATHACWVVCEMMVVVAFFFTVLSAGWLVINYHQECATGIVKIFLDVVAPYAKRLDECTTAEYSSYFYVRVYFFIIYLLVALVFYGCLYREARKINPEKIKNNINEMTIACGTPIKDFAPRLTRPLIKQSSSRGQHRSNRSICDCLNRILGRQCSSKH